MCALINGPLATERVVGELSRMYKLISPIVAQETIPVWEGLDPFDYQTMGHFAFEYRRLVQGDYRTRVESVRSQIESYGTSCPTP